MSIKLIFALRPFHPFTLAPRRPLSSVSLCYTLRHLHNLAPVLTGAFSFRFCSSGLLQGCRIRFDDDDEETLDIHDASVQEVGRTVSEWWLSELPAPVPDDPNPDEEEEEEDDDDEEEEEDEEDDLDEEEA